MTAAADQGLIDIHDRRPLVLVPEAAREWMRQDIGGKEAGKLPPMELYQLTILSGTRYLVLWVMLKTGGPELIERIT